jgi:hypothetical protein
MANSPRDENHVPAALGEDSVTGAATPWLCDTATGYALVSNVATPTLPTGLSGNARRDENHVTSLLGEDSVTGEVVPIACDADGNLICKFI